MINKYSDKLQSRRYIARGTVISLKAFFYVPKGEDDTRLVYDLTASGMNDTLWDPKFWMKSAEPLICHGLEA